MAFAQTALLPAPRLPVLLAFLRRELAPLPGRAIGTVRIVIACAVTVVICMALQIPEAHLAVWVALRVVTEEAGETLLAGLLMVLALTIGIAVSLVFLIVAMDQAWLRFCIMAAFAALGLFLRRTFVIPAFGFIIGLIGTLLMTVPDFVPIPELMVRASLWLWSVFAVGIAASVAVNLLVVPSDPAALLEEELRTRLSAAEGAMMDRLGVAAPDGVPAAQLRTLVTAGMSRMLALLRSVGVVHPSRAPCHAQMSALITLADRLVTAAAAVDLTAPPALAAVERARLERVVGECGRVRRALATGTAPEPEPPGVAASPEAGAAALPALAELEQVVDLLRDAVDAGEIVDEAAPPAAPQGPFVPDAFTNPEYLRYALKGSLAVMICYVLQTAVDWPGIRTCIVTCMIVGLTSEGATIQKATLRLSGALVGALLGFLSILLLVPEMESITSLVLLVAAGTAIAAWVDLGSARISYAGSQIALAFFVCVIQGFAPSWHFDTIRDRLVGILLGNTVITLVFLWVWPVDAASALWRHLAAALRTTARLATLEHGADDRVAMARTTAVLRDEADRHFTATQQAIEEAAFEPTVAGVVGRRREADAECVMSDAQAVFLSQLAVARHRPDLARDMLPPAVRASIRRLNDVVAERLAAVAEGLEDGAGGPLPDLRAPLGALAATVESSLAAGVGAEVASEVRGRVALYRALVPRIERLAAPQSAGGDRNAA